MYCQTGLQYLVNQAGKGAVDVVASLGTRFECVNAMLTTHLLQLFVRDLSSLSKVALVADNDDWNIAHLVQLSDPLANACKGLTARKIKDHEAGIETLHVRADYVRVGLLPGRIPDLGLRDRVTQDADVDRLSVCSMCLDLLFPQFGIRVDILELQTRLSNVHISKHGDLDRSRCRLFLRHSLYHFVPDLGCGQVGHGCYRARACCFAVVLLLMSIALSLLIHLRDRAYLAGKV